MSWHFHPSGLLVCAESFSAFPELRHGVTVGGGSRPDFNLSFSVAADFDSVRENRGRVCAALGFSLEQLVVPAQVHGVGVGIVGEVDRGNGAFSPETAVPQCDALVTRAPRVLLGITVADCLPVFLFDPVQRALGLVHSGWRGTAGRIAVKTLTAMTEAFGSRPEDCLCAIGPGIGGDGYEVDDRVHASFTPDDSNAPGVFFPTRPGHWRLDLTAAVLHQLRGGGISAAQVEVAPWRTCAHSELFFSHRLKPGCPRMGAFLGML